jgi:hypothetical protein
MPVFFVVTRERFVEQFAVVWVSALCGSMLSGGSWSRWSLPLKWKLPLVFWALLAAWAWPIILIREADFHLDQLRLLEYWPAVVATGVMAGILWFDWLFARYGSRDEADVESEVIVPLALGWALAAMVGVFQMFGSMTFVNPGFWVSTRRATGLLGDANVFGVISAMWGPAIAAVAFGKRDQWRGWRLATVALPLSWLAVWASGSRSSLLIVVLGLCGFVLGVWRATQSKRVALSVVIACLVGVLAMMVLMRGDTTAVGPVARIVDTFKPRWSIDWARQMAISLWVRDWYGTTSVEMIRRFPLVGVGLSEFYGLASVFSWVLLQRRLPFDNAQNWFRHELAELGLIGSLGWIAWTIFLLGALLMARSRPGRQVTAATLRLTLVGFGLVSLVGMPGQSLIVAFTFWTLAFWFLHETNALPAQPAHKLQSPMLAWVAVWALVFGHSVATAYVGWTALRPPVRAQWAGMDYSLGFYLPDGDGPDAFRWAKQRATAVVPAPKEWMEVTVKVNHPDLIQSPVDVRASVDGVSVLRTRLRTVDPVTRYVRVRPDERVIIETWTSRLHTDDSGPHDRRERGMLVRWNFVDAPPPDAIIAGS